MADTIYPVQIQADNIDAAESQAVCMCHVFDIKAQVCVLAALQKQYLHVIAWDKHGNKDFEYDNRRA
jgi:hypothetical protein